MTVLVPAQKDNTLIPAQQGDEPPGIMSEGLVQSIRQGGTLGWGDRLSAGLAAGAGYVLDPLQRKYNTLEQLYERNLNRDRHTLDAYREANPKAAMAGELGGNVLLGMATAGAGSMAGASATLPRMMALGATEGGIYGAGEARGQDVIENSLAGMAEGALMAPVAYGAGKILNRMTNTVRGHIQSQRLTQAGEQLGYQYTPYQKTADPAFRNMEIGMRRDPANVSKFTAMNTQNQALSNRLAASTIGESADDLGPATMEAAYQRITREFGEIPKDIGTMNIPESAGARARQLVADYEGMWGAKPFKVLTDAAEELRNKTLSPGRYAYLHSQLGKMQKTLAKDPAKLEAVSALRDILNDTVESNIRGPETLARWTRARDQWGNLNTLSKPGVINDLGDISEPILANKLRTENNMQYARGQSNKGALEAVARMGGQSKKGNFAGSPTSEALAAQRSVVGLLRDIPASLRGELYMRYPQLFLEAPTGLMGPAILPGMINATDAALTTDEVQP